MRMAPILGVHEPQRVFILRSGEAHEIRQIARRQRKVHPLFIRLRSRLRPTVFYLYVFFIEIVARPKVVVDIVAIFEYEVGRKNSHR